MKVESADIIHKVKEMINDHKGTPGNGFHLKYGTELLEETHNLNWYGISSNSYLTLVKPPLIVVRSVSTGMKIRNNRRRNHYGMRFNVFIQVIF